MRVVLRHDAGVATNPGPGGIGWVIERDGTVLAEGYDSLLRATNNEAEYQGLIRGLTECLGMGATIVDVKGDSRLVVMQIRSEWRIKEQRLIPFAVEVRRLIGRFERFSIEWVPREENRRADALATQGIKRAKAESELDGRLRSTILGCGGGIPSSARETACLLVREGNRALLLDAGSGVGRLRDDRRPLQGIDHIDVVLTHFHFDHICGMTALQWLPVEAAIWAPGRWLYDRPSTDILAPLRRPPISPGDVTAAPIFEIHEGVQEISGFAVRASAQPRHWAPSAGLRVGDDLAYVTDTPFEHSSIELARGVRTLFHEAWSSSDAPSDQESDSTAADAARVAAQAGVERLILVHLNPDLSDHAALVNDARRTFPNVALGEDGRLYG
ncbi:MAG TPA: reverse transcriptase-like protein [Gaiellales bacterium]|nr:reverse transcriptase-like protein [Gaiellales bacterium]